MAGTLYRVSVADRASIRAVLALLLTGLIFGLIWLTGGANAQIRAQEQSADIPAAVIEADSTSPLPTDPPLQTPTMDELVGDNTAAAAAAADVPNFAVLAATPSTPVIPVTTEASTTTTEVEVDETTTTTEVAETTTTTVEVTTTTHDHPTTTVAETTTTTEAPTTTTTLAVTTTTTEPPSETTTTTTPDYSGVLSESQARDLFGQYFSGDDVDVALRIARCESSLNTNAYNPAGYGGLFQHSIAYWDSRASAAGWAGASIYDGEANTAVAFWLYSQSGWSPWPNC